MLLSYFVFHQDKLDASFCHRLFHPPLSASNCFLFASVKTGVSIQLVVIATFCFATRNNLLDSSATAQNEIGFHIRFGRFVFYYGRLMKVQAFIHMIVQCALRCCATCIGSVLNKC